MCKWSAARKRPYRARSGREDAGSGLHAAALLQRGSRVPGVRQRGRGWRLRVPSIMLQKR